MLVSPTSYMAVELTTLALDPSSSGDFVPCNLILLLGTLLISTRLAERTKALEGDSSCVDESDNRCVLIGVCGRASASTSIDCAEVEAPCYIYVPGLFQPLHCHTISVGTTLTDGLSRFGSSDVCSPPSLPALTVDSDSVDPTRGPDLGLGHAWKGVVTVD